MHGGFWGLGGGFSVKVGDSASLEGAEEVRARMGTEKEGCRRKTDWFGRGVGAKPPRTPRGEPGRPGSGRQGGMGGLVWKNCWCPRKGSSAELNLRSAQPRSACGCFGFGAYGRLRRTQGVTYLRLPPSPRPTGCLRQAIWCLRQAALCTLCSLSTLCSGSRLLGSIRQKGAEGGGICGGGS